VNTGYHPWKGIENAVESRNPAANDFAEKMKKIRDEAAAALEKTQKRMKKYYDAHRRDAPEFKVGDKVWLEAGDITTDRPTKKMDDRRLGPYEILEKVGASAYKLKLPETDKSHPVFNEAKLTPYVEPPVERREERPPPQIISGHEEYEVEEILKHRKRGRGYQYLIKWKNYPLSERSWVPTRNLTNAKKLLDRYNVEHKIAVRAWSAISELDGMNEEEKKALAAHLREKGIMPPKTEESANSTTKQTVPIFKQGSWDYLIKRFNPKQKDQKYGQRKIFDPVTGRFNILEEFPTLPGVEAYTRQVDEDVDPKGGVMSRFDSNLIVPTPTILHRKCQGCHEYIDAHLSTEELGSKDDA